MYFVYDGTYPGFLTGVYEIYHFGTSRLEGISADNGTFRLFGEERKVETSFSKAEKVASSFEKSCGREAMRWMYRAFLSDDEGREMKIFTFIREGFKWKKKIYTRQREPWILEILHMCREVGNETEKFRGILRFSQLEDGLLYAAINPTHHILPLLALHFKERFPSSYWAICDIQHHEAAVYGGKKVSLVTVDKEEKHLKYGSMEEDFRQLWRNYYRHMGIKERRNPKARMNFIPKKYWPCLTEMEDTYNMQDISLLGIEEKERPGAGRNNLSAGRKENHGSAYEKKGTAGYGRRGNQADSCQVPHPSSGAAGRRADLCGARQLWISL